MNNVSDKLQSGISEDDGTNLLIIMKKFGKEVSDCLSVQEENPPSPDEEIKFVFKQMYALLQQKPHYLPIVFNPGLHGNNKELQKTILGIRQNIENHLTRLILKNSSDHQVISKVQARLLAGRILSSFRLFMKDELLLNEWASEVKALITIND